MALEVHAGGGTAPTTSAAPGNSHRAPSRAQAPWAQLDALAREHGDGFYVIDPAILDSNFHALQQAFACLGEHTLFAYSYKTNHTPSICRWALSRGMGAEVASALELAIARRVGVADERIVLTGVGRGANTVGDALSAGALVVLDGERDIESACTWATSRTHGGGDPGRVLLRVRVPTPAVPAPRLGMTPDALIQAHRRLSSLPGLHVEGLHCHLTDRGFAGLTARLDVMGEIGSRLFPDGPPILDLGNPLLPADPSEAISAWSPFAEAIARFLDDHSWVDTRVVLEPGAPIVANAVSLVARVLDVRTQPGRTVATVAASILHSSPNTRRVDFPVRLITPSGQDRSTAADPLFLAGATLIDLDWLAVDLPGSVQPGDFVVLDNVGAYSIGMDNSFIEPPLPVVVLQGDSWVTARRTPTVDEALAGFTW